MNIVIGSDHAGFLLKKKICEYLRDRHDVLDVGCDSDSSVDYPVYAKLVVQKVQQGGRYGILICGTGIGMSIAANRFKGIRASLCHNIDAAYATRAHNDSNILCLGSRTIEENIIFEIIDVYFSTKFDGGRHLKRLCLIDK